MNRPSSSTTGRADSECRTACRAAISWSTVADEREAKVARPLARGSDRNLQARMLSRDFESQRGVLGLVSFQHG